MPGLLGLILWRAGVAGRTQSMQPESTGSSGLALFLIGFAALQVLSVVCMQIVGGDVSELSLSTSLAVQAGSNVGAVVLVLCLVTRLPGGLAGLGLRGHQGAWAWLTALAVWLTALPLLMGAKWANGGLLELLGQAPKTQQHLLRFLDEGSVDRLWIWTAMVLILPVCEEILFRGALYGGLRRHMPAALAMLVSGLVFGLLHDPSVMLPVAALGAVLAWVYERTGSLKVPCLVHVLQNGVTLTLVTLFPEEIL